MTKGCKIDKPDAAYFLTFTTVEWMPVFSEDRFKLLICDSLNFCIEEKKLEVFCYVLMDTHMHLIARAENENLSDIVRDFKKFTSSCIIRILQQEICDTFEKYLIVFKEAASRHTRNINFQVWQQNNHPEEVYSPKFTLSKIKYIHNNPVEAGLVNWPHEYRYSSAADYADGVGPVKVSVINLHNLYY